MIRVRVAVVTSILVMFTGAPAAVAATAPAGRWSVPLDVAPPKIDISVSSVTYDCGDQSPIRIAGEDATVTLNGSCGEVDVSGAANTVNLQAVAIIKATGSSNHITWESGRGGAVPQISNPNGSNDITGPGGFQVPQGKG
jgi:hypothetical protein